VELKPNITLKILFEGGEISLATKEFKRTIAGGKIK